jgi:hypothetical protein
MGFRPNVGGRDRSVDGEQKPRVATLSVPTIPLTVVPAEFSEAADHIRGLAARLQPYPISLVDAICACSTDVQATGLWRSIDRRRAFANRLCFRHYTPGLSATRGAVVLPHPNSAHDWVCPGGADFARACASRQGRACGRHDPRRLCPVGVLFGYTAAGDI